MIKHPSGHSSQRVSANGSRHLLAADSVLVSMLMHRLVYLAIATAISNAALQCALAEAAPVSWWYKALQGSTVKDLELDWEAG